MSASTATISPPAVRAPAPRRRPHPVRPARLLLHAFLVLVALGWLAPLALGVYASLRPYHETAQYGYFSWPHKLTFSYYIDAWTNGDMPKYFVNTLIVAVPGVIVTLFLASFVAFAITRVRIPCCSPPATCCRSR